MTLKEYSRYWGLFVLTLVVMGASWQIAKAEQWGTAAELGAVFVPFLIFGFVTIGNLINSKSIVDHASGKLAMQQALLLQHEEHIDALAKEKNQAYLERNYMVSALARVYRSGIRDTDIEGWNPEWNGCVYIDLPTGQISFHYHSSQAFLFEKLPPWTERWDGHDKNEVFDRILRHNESVENQYHGMIPSAAIRAWAQSRIAITATNPDVRAEEHAMWQMIDGELELFTLRYNVDRLQGRPPRGSY